MRIRIFITLSLALLFISALVGPAYAPTKIVPTDGAEPGEPFTILDTPEGRLVDGSVAVFDRNGAAIEVTLRTHKPSKTARARLPEDIAGGSYDVFVRRPDGAEFAVGSFTVLAPVLGEPSVEPICGIRKTFLGDGTLLTIGTSFTITDPQGRMEPGDVAAFRLEGTDPASGIVAENIVIDGGGTTLTANVPALSSLSGVGRQHVISVGPTLAGPPRFGDLAFFITAFNFRDGTIFPLACIQPTIGPSGTPFTIFDPQGRMAEATAITFDKRVLHELRQHPVTDPAFSADGETATGTVPSVLGFEEGGGFYGVLVHSSTGTEPTPIGHFYVQSSSGLFISPVFGPCGTVLTITDPQGRLEGADRILFSVPGDAFENGTPADAFEFVGPTQVRGTVPLECDGGITHNVTVHAGDPALNHPLVDVLEFIVTLG